LNMNLNNGLKRNANLILLLLSGICAVKGQNTTRKKIDVKLHVGEYITINDGKNNLDGRPIIYNQTSGPADFLIYSPPAKPYLDLTPYKRLNVISKWKNINIEISRIRADSLFLHDSFGSVDIQRASLPYLEFSSDNGLKYHSLNISRVKSTKDIVIQTDTIGNLGLENDTLNNLDLSKVTILNNSHVSGIISGTIDLSHFSGANDAVLDLTDVMPGSYGKIKVKLSDANLKSLNIDYSKVELIVDSPATYEKIKKTYAPILKKLKNDDDELDYRRVFLAEQQALNKQSNNPLVSSIDKYWWNYGLNTDWLLLWAMMLFLVFATINLFFFDRILEEYVIDSVVKRNQEIKDENASRPMRLSIIRYMLVLVYSANLFFGFKIELEKLTFKNPRILLYIILQYSTGLLCLLYIAHYYFKTL
jgi:hypothetical protein